MSDWNRPKRRRLSIDIPEEIYMQTRTTALSRNCTLTKWVIRAMLSQLNEEHFREKSKSVLEEAHKKVGLGE